MEPKWPRLIAWFGFTVVLGLSGPIVQTIHSLDFGTVWQGWDLVSHGELYAAAVGLSLVAVSRVIAVDEKSWLNSRAGKRARWGLGVAAAVTLVTSAYGVGDAINASHLATFGIAMSVVMYVLGGIWSLLGEVILH